MTGSMSKGAQNKSLNRTATSKQTIGFSKKASQAQLPEAIKQSNSKLLSRDKSVPNIVSKSQQLTASKTQVKIANVEITPEEMK